ncbi:MAG: transglutaminase domain-containing protein [Candidatus Gracilibacteria bacterium]|jgi:transglutaminase-like putative cysteine protease
MNTRNSQPTEIESTSRRRFLFSAIEAAAALTLITTPACQAIAEALGKGKALSIEEQKARIHGLNIDKKPDEEIQWNVKKMTGNLTEDLNEGEARQKLFEFIQSFPYELRSFKARGGIELYDEEKGDCRHKSNALYALLKQRGFEVRKLDVLFDWKDLPIPKEILALKKRSGTRAFHDGIEVKIDGKWVYVDPTWDPALAHVGFPVTTNWDGASPTKEISNGKTEKIPAGKYEKFEDYLAAYKMPWPVRSETDAFNKALNEWLNKQRSAK